MKIFRLVLAVLAVCSIAAAQNNSISFAAAPPQLATGLRANVVGAGGQTTYYYWVTARYPIGVTMPAGPVRVVNAANVLAAPNSVTVAWTGAAGATGYDVIRLTTPTFPQTGTCVNCVIASNTAATSFSDIGGAVVNWPTVGTTFAGQARASITLNNRDFAVATLVFSGAAVSMGGFTANSMLYSGGTGLVTATTAATDGQILIGDTGAIPVKASITGTANQITMTPGPGSITLSTPQDIATTSTPTFAGAILSGAGLYGIDMDAGTMTNELRFRDGNIIRATAADATGLLSLGTKETVVAPVRIAGEYAYGFDINPDDTFYVGAGVQKSYLLSVRGERPVGSVATGDSNDASLKMNYSNYAANDANFIIRGINTLTTNRGGGTLGMVEGGLISSATRVGGVSPIQRGLYVGAENYGAVADEFGGIRVDVRNEAAVATLEYGVKVINTNNSLATAVNSAYLVSDTGANIGFNYGLDMTGATIQVADISLSTGSRIYAGNGVPGAGLCDAPRLGSIYLNLGGGGGTSLYVCEVAGAWAAK